MISDRLSLFSQRDYSLIVFSQKEHFDRIELDLPALSRLLLVDLTIPKKIKSKHAKENF
jgi:hypothetical protein